MALRHSASFLQTFHTAQTAAQRTAESQTATPTDRMDTDPAALAFVKGQRPAKFAAPADGSYECEIGGHKVRCGGAYVSEKQAKWIIDIATTRETPGPAEAVLVRLEQGFAKFAGSQFITTYKDLPKKSIDSGKMLEAECPQVTVEKFHSGAPQVADGRYAVEHEGVLKFYKVKNGRKPGYVFLDVQASDDWHSIRTPRRIHEILALIAQDADEASLRYGRELGICGDCGRTLTDETSRARGRGPVCDAKH
jgi:hypothetical protein